MLALAKRPTLALDVNIVQDNLPIEIAPKLYIGSIHAAFNQEALLSHKITHILNASRLPPSFPKNFTYLSVDVRDKEDANILSCIPASNIFIEAGVEAGGVLVHCFGGRSRSAAFIAAYLMCHCGWSYESTLKVIVTARPVASVNKGFEKQLRSYALTGFDVYAAQQVLLRNRIKALRDIRTLNMSKSGGLAGVSWRGGPKGGNKRSWADRDSLSAKGMGSMNEEQKAIEEEGIEDEELDGDEDIESEKDHLSEMDDSGKTASSSWKNPETFLKEGGTGAGGGGVEHTQHQHRVGQSDFGLEEEDVLKFKKKDRNKGGRGSGTMTPLTPRRTPVPYLDPKSPRCRLSRPGSSTVRVIPPLRGLERAVCCAYCGEGLFCLANILRVNTKMSRDDEKQDRRKSTHTAPSSSSPSPHFSFTTPGAFSSFSLPFSAPSQVLSMEMGDLKMNIQSGESSLEDYKVSLTDFKAIKRDLKRDCEGEHKMERPPSDRSYVPFSPRGSGFSDQKMPPQSVRGSATKKFDFEFEKPSGSVSKSNCSSSGSSAQKLFGEREGLVHSPFALKANTNSDSDCIDANPNPNMNMMRLRERRQADQDRDRRRDIEGSRDMADSSHEMQDRCRSVWGLCVSDDAVLPSAYGESGLKSVRRCGDKSPAYSDYPLSPAASVSSEERREGRRKSLGDVKMVSGLGLGHGSPSFLHNSGTGSLLNSWGSVDALRAERPPSAEKRRWMARMSLLSSASTPAVSLTPTSAASSSGSCLGSGSGHNTESRQTDSMNRMKQMAHDDEEAMRLVFGGTDSDPSSSPSPERQYLYVEYLAWMDPDGRVLDPNPSDGVLEERDCEMERETEGDGDFDVADGDAGEIKCRHCDKSIGKWTWNPTGIQSLRGQLDPPVFMILKSDVHQADFSLDPTPQSTPRLVEDPEESPSGSFTYGTEDI